MSAVDFDFTSFGARKEVRFGADPNDPAGHIWNFGVAPKNTEVETLIQATPSLYQRFPNLQGKWDGKTRVNHHEAVRKVLGGDIKAQYQVRGTCGGRAGSQGLDILQCVLIASGKRAKFHRVSHAAVYYFARKKYGMLSGNPNDENNDGVAGGSVPEILSEMGAVQREEDNDSNFYGDGSDDLACLWGCGRITPQLAKTLADFGKDNLVTAKVRAKSAQECADGLAAGGVIIQSDSQGYSMQRDSEGVCRAQGTWAHYQIRTGVGVTPRGRKVFDYNQSWGVDTPSGSLLPGCPGNCFGVEWDVQDHLCRTGEVDIIFGFDPFDLENDNYDLPWVF